MKEISIKTNNQTCFVNSTAEVQSAVSTLCVKSSAGTVFVPHTAAGITVNENADPDVVMDMKVVLDKRMPLPEKYSHFEGHKAEYVKASRMRASLQGIVENGQLQLGCWQGICFCEFDGPRCRKYWVK